MPRRELKNGKQVADWLRQVSVRLCNPANVTLIGSAALLWHSHRRGINVELPEASMDIDPITDSDEVAVMCYEALIGSEFEKVNGWHVNLMPDTVLRDLPAGWQTRATVIAIEKLTLTVPAVVDLLAPKLKRNEPRDRAHAEWARTIGLLD